MVDPIVHHDVIDSGTLGRVIVQDLRDQVTSAIRDGHVVGEVVRIHTNSLVSRLNVRRLKGRLTDDKCVNDDADGPDIDLVRVTLLAFKHLRSDVVRSTTDGSLALAIELQLGSETEITDFDLHFVVKEEIAELEISMDDAMTVEVLNGGADLVDVALDLELVEALAAAQQLVQRLVLAQLQEDVDVLGVLEEVLEADDVVLVQGSVNLDLTHQLLLGSSLGQSGLHNDFGGRDTLVFEVGELETAGETTFTEELALEVLLDADFAVVLDDFLFDDRLGTVHALFLLVMLHFTTDFF